MSSTTNHLNLIYDFRKYKWFLSEKNSDYNKEILFYFFMPLSAF